MGFGLAEIGCVEKRIWKLGGLGLWIEVVQGVEREFGVLKVCF